MNIFTTSGSCWSKKRLLRVSRAEISAISSSESVKSNKSRFSSMRSMCVDLGMMMTSAAEANARLPERRFCHICFLYPQGQDWKRNRYDLLQGEPWYTPYPTWGITPPLLRVTFFIVLSILISATNNDYHWMLLQTEWQKPEIWKEIPKIIQVTVSSVQPLKDK